MLDFINKVEGRNYATNYLYLSGCTQSQALEIQPTVSVASSLSIDSEGPKTKTWNQHKFRNWSGVENSISLAITPSTTPSSSNKHNPNFSVGYVRVLG